jgi:hypothetical protein
MATLENYCQIVRELLAEHATNNDPKIESQVISDTENNHYLLVDIGWQGNERIYASYVHIDIKDGKIWIQQNMTEIDLGQELVALMCTTIRHYLRFTSSLQASLHKLWRCLNGYDNSSG